MLIPETTGVDTLCGIFNSLHLNADNLDEILQAYRELYPAIPLKDVYMFFDEVQMADD